MNRFLMNTTILACDGNYSLRTISSEDAQKWASEPFVSTIGHEGTATVAQELLGVPVEANRVFAILEPGDEALCLKLTGRLPEGKVLSAEELRDFPKEWKILRREE